MAVDTRDKRASVLGIAGSSRSLALPNPDGTIGTSDRAQTDYSYSGLLIDPGSIGGVSSSMGIGLTHVGTYKIGVS